VGVSARAGTGMDCAGVDGAGATEIEGKNACVLRVSAFELGAEAEVVAPSFLWKNLPRRNIFFPPADGGAGAVSASVGVRVGVGVGVRAGIPAGCGCGAQDWSDATDAADDVGSGMHARLPLRP
jgi:hypothetical protein